jgi:hypothetical protein
MISLLPMTGMSDKAILHRPGIMVIEKCNDENGEVEVIPIDPIIKKLELEKAAIQEQEQEQKQTGYKLRIKEIELEIKDINEKAEKLIDLNNQDGTIRPAIDVHSNSDQVTGYET